MLEPRRRILQGWLRECGALQPVYPEIDALFGVPQPARWHPEIDTGVHTLMVLDQAALAKSGAHGSLLRPWFMISARARRRVRSGRVIEDMRSAASR